MTPVQSCSFHLIDHTYTISFGSSQTLRVEVSDLSKHNLLKADYFIHDTSNTLPSTINQLFQRISAMTPIKELDPIIQNDLGYYYEVNEDPEKAFNCYQQAAENGFGGGYHTLGASYQKGTGIGVNLTLAFECFTKAVDLGYFRSYYKLGYCHMHGLGTEVNHNKGFSCYATGAEKGCRISQYNLAYCYQKGIGVKEDFTKAVHWYRQAAEQGDLSAQNKLGRCYENGIGVEKNLETAMVWYHKAGENGHVRAQYRLGFNYENGIGVEKNLQKALDWYQKAEKQGYKSTPILIQLAITEKRVINFFQNIGTSITSAVLPSKQ
ncbi:MAG TPA: tetratricopeptide repeat protein [Rhabdochlamydiaceae bacterium]|jgi:TPR repeat protein|nr:tetratricopeptide repeat protein [Rhabdochlamydiaceae bacterium]